MMGQRPSICSMTAFPSSLNFLGALNMPGLIRTVPTPRATAISAFQVMGGREDHQAIFEIPVWLLRAGFLGRIWFVWWHGNHSR